MQDSPYGLQSAPSIMDNLTHTLVGYALGRAAGPCGERHDDGAHALGRGTIWTSVVASNILDADFMASLVADEPKLAYLLHHRGHTHTLLFALPLGWGIGMLLSRAFGVEAGRRRRRVCWVGVAAALLHLGFDLLNNYGVHPFFPVDNAWYNGDAVFIVEPWLLAVLLPIPAVHAFTRAGRILARVLCVAVVGLCWGLPLLSVPAALSTTLLMAACVGAAVRGRFHARGALMASLACVLAFVTGSRTATATARAALVELAPDEHVAQLVLTPAPGNPICWNALAVSTDDTGQYRVRFIDVGLIPSWLSAKRCHFMPWGETTAPLRPVPLRARGAAVRFGLHFQAPLRELKELARTHCDVRAALRFIRAAYWTRDRVVGDLRYDTSDELDFADIPVDDECVDVIPPWKPPLSELL